MPIYRRRYRRSRSRTIPGGTKAVRAGPKRDVPMYSVRAPQRVLTHITPLTSGVTNLRANNAVPVNATYPNQTLLNIVARGTGLDLRDNNKIFMRDIFLNMAISAETGTVAAACTVRLALVYDRDPHGTQCTVADVFDSPEMFYFPKIANRERFDILYLKNVVMGKAPIWNGTTVIYGQGPACYRYLRVRIPIRRYTTWAPTDTAGTISGMDKGALYLFFTNVDAPSAANANVTISHRLTFDSVM